MGWGGGARGEGGIDMLATFRVAVFIPVESHNK